MAIGKNGDATYVPILPSFDKFFTETEKASAKAGKTAGQRFTEQMERETARAQKAADSAGRAMERAQNRAANAADKTRVAQLKLAEALEKTDAKASTVAKATADVARAQRDEELAAKAATRASEKYEKAKEGLASKTAEANRALELGSDALDDYAASARGARGDVDQLGESAGGLGSRIIDGAKTIGKGALLGVGAKIGQTMMSGVHDAVSGGFARLGNIEQAETMLSGLGHSAEAVKGIMDNAMTAVKGTAFGFGDAASAAATFIGAGVAQGEELTRVLTLVGDTAAITGSDFNEMGAIWSKIAGNQKLSTEELNQLLDRGLGLLPALQEKYGVTADEARKMVTEGKVSFEDFSAVMEDMVGGSAQKMGETFSGSAANMKAALGRLGAQLLEPVFANAPAVFDAVGAAVDELGKRLEPAIAAFSDWLAPIMQKVAENLGPALIATLDGVTGAVTGLFEFVRGNQEWLMPLAAGLTAVAAGLAAANLQMKIAKAGGFVSWVVQAAKATQAWSVATNIAAGAQKLFNLAVKSNPIIRIVTVLGAAAAALGVFFTQTETGREMWESLTTTVTAGLEVAKAAFFSFAETARGAWETLSAGISAAWTTVIKPVFDALSLAARTLVTVIATAVVAPILIAWNLLATTIKAAWDYVIKPVFDAMALGAQWMWNQVLKPTFEAISTGFQALGVLVQAIWTTYIKAAWDALAAAGQWLWESVLSPVFTAIGDGFRMVGDGFMWVWENLLRPVVDAFADGFRWLHDEVIAPVSAWMAEKWQLMSVAFAVVKDFIVDTVFGGIQSGLDTLKGWFDTTVAGIGILWAGIKALTAKPAQFVVDVVFNKGIRKAWNGVAKFTGLDELEEIKVSELGAYASGGILPGYSPGRDIYRMVDPRTGTRVDLSGGEAIMRPEFAAVVGEQSIESINRAARQGGRAGVARLLGQGAQFAYARGGIFPNGDTEIKEDQAVRIARAVAFMEREDGKPYQWGGVGDPSWDCSGLWSGIVHELNGRDGRSGRQFNTTSLMANPSAWGFERGLNGPITVGVSNDHMAGTLAGTNAESRGGDGVLWGRGAWGSTNSYFPNKYTLSAFLGEFMPGAEGGGGSRFNPASLAKSIWDGIIDRLPKFEGPGLIGQLPGAMLAKLAGSAWDFVSSKIGSFFDAFTGGSGTAGSAESWRDMAMWAMRREGFNADDPAQVNAMLAQIMSESGGNPGIAQQIVDVNGTGESAGVGLLQIIPGTFAAHRDPSLPNDRRDPEANMVAALRYYKARYGNDLTTMWGHGHGYASGGVLPGYTPGRDVHQFYSPTAGWLGLSGGEAIMVPEWTRSVGGPAAVAEMNRAARGGRSSSAGRGVGFADGGVAFWDPIAQRQRAVADTLAADIDRLVRELRADRDPQKFAAGLEVALQPAIAELRTIANPSTYEGVMARALVSKGGELADLLGLETTAGAVSLMLGAERSLIEARESHAQRVAALADKEAELETMRERLAELEGETTELSVKDQRKLADAEKALADARREAGEVDRAGVSSSAASAESSEKAAAAEDKLAAKREKSSEKVEKAEENLRRIREDLGVKEEQDAEKRAEEASKLAEQIAAAELDLASARRASVENLDMSLYSVLPQVADGATRLAAQLTAAAPQILEMVGTHVPQAVGMVSAAIPQATGALESLAAAAGPAGISVGVAVAGVFALVKVGKAIVDFADRIIGQITAGRVAFAEALGDFSASIREIMGLVEKQRQMVSSLRMDLVRQTILQTKAAMDSRDANAALVRSRLEGDRSVAEAQSALQAEIQKEARKSAGAYGDLSLAYDRYRYNEIAAMVDRLETQAVVTPEIKALMHELDVAELTRMANVQRATADAIEASYAHRAANRAVLRTTEDLERAAARLADMTGTAFGMDQSGARLGEEVAKLYAENAEIQGRLWSWKNGLSVGYNKRVRKHDEAALRRNQERLAELQAMPEYQGFGVSNRELSQLQNDVANLYKWGKTDEAAALLQQSVLGDPRRAADAFQLKSDLAAIADAQIGKQREVEDFEDEVSLNEATRPLRDAAASLESLAESSKLRAEALRTDDVDVARRIEAMADFERENALDIQRVSRGEPSRIELTFTDKAAYSAAEVDELLSRVGDVDGLELRIRKLETQNRPGASDLVRARR